VPGARSCSIEHKIGSLIIWLFLFIKHRRGILHRKLSVKSMVAEKIRRVGCGDPPQPPASSIFLLSLQIARGQNAEKVLHTSNARTQAKENVVIFCHFQQFIKTPKALIFYLFPLNTYL